MINWFKWKKIDEQLETSEEDPYEHCTCDFCTYEHEEDEELD